jgi:hypothetical protein
MSPGGTTQQQVNCIPTLITVSCWLFASAGEWRAHYPGEWRRERWAVYTFERRRPPASGSTWDNARSTLPEWRYRPGCSTMVTSKCCGTGLSGTSVSLGTCIPLRHTLRCGCKLFFLFKYTTPCALTLRLRGLQAVVDVAAYDAPEKTKAGRFVYTAEVYCSVYWVTNA